MTYPPDFPHESRARVEAEKIRAGRDFDSAKLTAKWNSDVETHLRRYILRTFLVFANEARSLRLWPVADMDTKCREFLRSLTIDAHYEKGYDRAGGRLRDMNSSWNGAILSEVQQDFEKTQEWQRYLDALLEVAEAQGATRSQSSSGAALEGLRLEEADDNSASTIATRRGPLRRAARRSRLGERLKTEVALASLGLSPPDRLELAEAIETFVPELINPKRKRLVHLPPVGPATLGTAPVGKIGLPRGPNRRVSEASADFDATVGRWMHEAHSRLERKGVKASRGRRTPNLPPAQYRKIVGRTDGAKRNGKPRFPLKVVLSKKVWREIAEHNRKAGVATKKLSRWSDVAFLPQFKRNVRHRYNRAEIYYRKHFIPQQS